VEFHVPEGLSVKAVTIAAIVISPTVAAIVQVLWTGKLEGEGTLGKQMVAQPRAHPHVLSLL
jgi:hypothetical protein